MLLNICSFIQISWSDCLSSIRFRILFYFDIYYGDALFILMVSFILISSLIIDYGDICVCVCLMYICLWCVWMLEWYWNKRWNIIWNWAFGVYPYKTSINTSVFIIGKNSYLNLVPYFHIVGISTFIYGPFKIKYVYFSIFGII